MLDNHGIIENTKYADGNVDADAFIKPFAENATFQMGEGPVIEGKMKIRDTLAHFFSSNNVTTITHEIDIMWDFDGELVYKATAFMMFSDGSSVSKPYVNRIVHSAGVVSSYRIYIS